jgi:DNA-directed RNA polymerase subunit M/transcription elongation factor TFIIS
MRDCPECGGEMLLTEVPVLFKNRRLYESLWVCQKCEYTEEVEPDPDSLKGGRDHE